MFIFSAFFFREASQFFVSLKHFIARTSHLYKCFPFVIERSPWFFFQSSFTVYINHPKNVGIIVNSS